MSVSGHKQYLMDYNPRAQPEKIGESPLTMFICQHIHREKLAGLINPVVKAYRARKKAPMSTYKPRRYRSPQRDRKDISRKNDDDRPVKSRDDVRRREGRDDRTNARQDPPRRPRTEKARHAALDEPSSDDDDGDQSSESDHSLKYTKSPTLRLKGLWLAS